MTNISTDKDFLMYQEKKQFFITNLLPHVEKFEESLKLKRKKNSGRKRKYELKEYIAYIYLSLSVTSWNILMLANPNDSKLIISAKKYFYKLCKYDVIINSYIDDLKIYDDKNKKKLFCIDSRTTKNMNGVEELGFCYKIKSKQSLKTSVITDDNRVIYSLLIHSSNTHDVKVVEKVVDAMFVNRSSYHNQYYIAGDKGYISHDIANNLKTKNIILVTPDKDIPKKIPKEIKKELIQLGKERKSSLDKLRKKVNKLRCKIVSIEKKIEKTKRKSKKDRLLDEINEIKEEIKINEDEQELVNKESAKKDNNIRRKTRNQKSKIKIEALKLRSNVENYFAITNKKYKRCEQMVNRRIKYFNNYLILSSYDILIGVK